MNRLNIVTLGTKDMVRSHNFYKKLGFETSVRGEESNPDIIFFKNKGTKIALYPSEELALDIDEKDPPETAKGFAGITLAYNAKSKGEVDEIFERAKKAEANIVKEPQKTDWGGYGGYFKDLDGHHWEVAYGEMWEFDECDMLVIDDE